MRPEIDGDLGLEALELLIGREIGGGATRTVYLLAHDTACVLKLESRDPAHPAYFQNINEWRVWEDVKSTPLAKWFAPCVAISRDGRALLQRRTTRPTAFPSHMPSFLDDLQLSNYGMFDGRFVCHDYGFVRTNYATRLRKADWILT